MPYEFNEENWRKFSEDILAAGGDQATLTSVLADMGDTFITGVNTAEQTRSENESVRQENARLKDANMNLFLRVGEQQALKDKDKQDKVKDTEHGHAVDSYLDNLFKEKEND